MTKIEAGSQKRPKGGSKPGERRGGRQKGTPNKLTADIKSAILAAFNKVGGEDYLAIQAHENPQAFLTLLGKVLPTQVSADLAGKLEITWASSGS